jgi:lysophospholipase L1-like esterase
VALQKKSIMKKYFFIFTSFIYSLSLCAQTAIDTTYKTTYYEQKVTLFHLLPNTKGEIIFLGNSITDIGEWAEIWQNKKVRNRGVSGDNTFGVLARLDEITASKPAKVFIMIGINDIAKETPDTVIIANYKKIINRIQSESPKTKINVQSILPTNNDFTEFKRHQNKMEHVIFINAALENYCKEIGLVYVDLYTAFLDDNKKLDKKYTYDGLHINGYGYMKWKEILVGMGLMK